MTSQIIGSGKHKRETVVCNMESKKDDSPLKARFLTMRKEIYNHYTEKHKTEQQTVSVSLKRGMSECERESAVIEIDTDITTPGASQPDCHRQIDQETLSIYLLQYADLAQSERRASYELVGTLNV